MSQNEQAIADLQAQVAFQDDLIVQLNQVVTKQDAILRELEETVRILKQEYRQMRELLLSGGTSSGDIIEKPPHY